MFFNEKLRMLRKESGLTQEELADKLNVSRQAITKWESGDGTPDIENLKQISILFNTTIDELVKEDRDVQFENSEKYSLVQEIEIDHSKHFDIKICKIYELNIIASAKEKVKIEMLSKENLSENYKIKFDDLYNRLDINIKSEAEIDDVIVNIFIPEKYIDEIELNSKIKVLNISNLDLKEFEYDGALKYLNVNNSKGKIVLNATMSDVEVNYDKFEGYLEVNTINSTARVKLPKGTQYRTVLKGIKNQFIDAVNVEESENVIELNGVNSKLMVTE
ncbi:MAG: helix-turn-helix domain-containing protein [Clostridia bacterium]|nr:helix-turn-helix domain-containing protein [Clostridia bacterium]